MQKKGLLYDKKRKTRAGYLSKTYKDVIICLSVLPRLQFSIHLITQTLLGPVAVTVAWLYIKPFREGPTGDPVDSDPDNKHLNWWKGVTNPDCLLSEPTVWSHKDFAILYETLTVFTHLACSRKPIYIAVQWYPLRCGLSSTYHLVPLAWYLRDR